MTNVRVSFEKWWTQKQTNTPLPWNLKEMFWLAFADGWHRGEIGRREPSPPPVIDCEPRCVSPRERFK